MGHETLRDQAIRAYEQRLEKDRKLKEEQQAKLRAKAEDWFRKRISWFQLNSPDGHLTFEEETGRGLVATLSSKQTGEQLKFIRVRSEELHLLSRCPKCEKELPTEALRDRASLGKALKQESSHACGSLLRRPRNV